MSSSGLHNELSAGASSGKQECLESESSRPCTSGMEAFCTNCTSSCGGGREGRKNNMGVQCKCKCSQTTRTTSTVNKKKKKREMAKTDLGFGVQFIRKHGSPCAAPAGATVIHHRENATLVQISTCLNGHNTHLKVDLLIYGF